MRRLAAAAAFLLGCALALSGVAAEGRSAAPGTIPEVSLAELPREARDTLALVRKGGPFPYDRDGIVFGNFEGRLPRQARGYYREYTVKTPGVAHRGARRIVAGCGSAGVKASGSERLLAPCDAGEYYYTEDHYNSFRRIRE